ncbi:DUF1501 domain-containing protein [Planctomicrobium sp.]|jgi:hypothetical protein|nr:DUF1501 domain-containing protein [Planctomicrobium sp.]MDA7503421.1 DUF1501 domain-containing protein [bacterium]MDA7527794.1 DUF1501 domain-containing protein [bacterium]MDB4743467.1 DUF1501 domain-containing protein [Planctomicrobium sp.]
MTGQNGFITRRDLLARGGMGIGALALAGVMKDALGNDASSAINIDSPLAPRQPHFPSKAKRVIHLFLSGGPSHVDTFDPKPALDKHHGQPLPESMHLVTERRTGTVMRSPFKFQRYGQSGIEVSEIFSHIGEGIDDIAVIRSMQADVPNHIPSILLMNCGDSRLIRPSLGAWATYGLGSENQNLPGFIAMKPGGYPGNGGTQNWQSAFLPGAHQGTYINTQHTQIEKLIENTTNQRVSRDEQSRQLELLRELNEVHRQQIDNNSQVDARIQSFELASRMQLEATDAFDVSQEPQSIHRMYGAGTEARQLMIARRLVERGVRFVQAWVGSDWDHHQNLEQSHRSMAKQCDQVIGALLKDLKLRGMLEDTLVIWGGEFGRTPTVEVPMGLPNNLHGNGRDHNHHGFTTWLAGGGVKGGYVHGATDEFGFKAVDKKVHVHDLHATILHLLGFDHTRLTYRHASRDFRLTDVFGDVVHDLIA